MRSHSQLNQQQDMNTIQDHMCTSGKLRLVTNVSLFII